MLFSYTVDYSNNPIMIVSRKKDKKKEKIHAQTAGLLLSTMYAMRTAGLSPCQ